MKAKTVTQEEIIKLARLAALPLTQGQMISLTKQIGVTVDYISKLQELDTKNIEVTSQVTGLENVFREDVIDTSRMFTQEEALANAKETQSGMIVADHVFGE